jgi:hypothetical protein
MDPDTLPHQTVRHLTEDGDGVPDARAALQDIFIQYVVEHMLYLFAVLQIREILVWIRIRILLFSSSPFKTQTKSFSACSFTVLFECTFTSFFKNKR